MRNKKFEVQTTTIPCKCNGIAFEHEIGYKITNYLDTNYLEIYCLFDGKTIMPIYLNKPQNIEIYLRSGEIMIKDNYDYIKYEVLAMFEEVTKITYYFKQ